MNFQSDFFIGAATCAHQVEGNNIHSDFWAMEQMENSSFTEPSLDAVDHYNRYEEDILLMKNAGLNAYRFSIEWARIEPQQGVFDAAEIEHYRKVLQCCRANGIEPIVTMHHFSSPKWLITAGGWEAETTVSYFANYCKYVVEQIGDLITYVCTINEANMGLQLTALVKKIMKQMEAQQNQAESNVQVGVNLQMQKMQEAMMETAKTFNVADPRTVHTFLSQRTVDGDLLIMRAHETARDAMKETCPHMKIGVTLSLHDIQCIPGGEEQAASEWNDEFLHYLPYIKNDDFLGLQNYTRSVMGSNGIMPAPEGAELTQMDYEFYPEALANVIREVTQDFKGDIIVTENGIATTDDSRRIEFIRRALDGIKGCVADGIPVKGYLYWSLMDNFEWQKGFGMTFGLIAVDRSTQTRHPKGSLAFLGGIR